MGTIIVWCVGVLLMLLGLIGCFVHRVPGPILTLIGLLVIQYGGDVKLFSTTAIVICVVAVVLAKVLEHFIPKLASLIHEVNKPGKWGCVIGSIIGLIIMTNLSESGSTGMVIFGLVLAMGFVPYACAFLLELTRKQPMKETLMATNAAYVTFLLGTALKLAVCLYCIYTAFTNY